MAIEQILVIAIVLGLVVIGIAFLRGRGSRGRAVASQAEGIAARSSASGSDGSESPEDAVQRLAETINALKRLSELRDIEMQDPPAPTPDSSTTSSSGHRRRSERPSAPAPAQGGWRPIGSGKGGPPTAPIPAVVHHPIPTNGNGNGDPVTTSGVDDLRVQVGRAFSPAAPVSNRDLFAGRSQQMETLVDAVFETGQHGVIYGERGVGKTSLASIMALVFADHETKLPIRVNCITADDFTSIWRKVFDEIELAIEVQGLPNSEPMLETLRATIAKDKIIPNDVRKTFRMLSPIKQCVVFIDEFDTVENPSVAQQMADLLKMLSDQLVPVTVVIIGVAENIDQLLAEHASIQRNLVLIHMPRMSSDEIKEIVGRGLAMLSMTIDPEALELVAHLSQGFPHYTHLIAQSAVRSAIEDDDTSIDLQHVQAALQKVSARIHTSIQDAYSHATASSRDALYPEVLMASALAECDDRGFFSPVDVREPLSAIMGKPYDIPTFARHLNALSDDERGPVLEKTGEARKFRYRFADPLLQPYVIMQGVITGTVTAVVLEQFSDHAAAATHA